MSAIPCQLFGSWSTPFDEPFALRKSLLVPAIHVAVFDSKMLRPFFQVFGNAINFNFDVAFPVVGLVFHGSPTTVVRRIAKIVVYALNRHAVRACSHIVVKTFKILPFIAHRYAATAVTIKETIARISASGFHVDPDSIGPSAIVAMLKKAVIVFLFQASARSLVTGRQRVRACDGCAPAFALTEPSCMRLPNDSLSTDDCQPGKFFP